MMADTPYVILTYSGPVGPFDTMEDATSWGDAWQKKQEAADLDASWDAVMQSDEHIAAFKASPVPIRDPKSFDLG